MSTTSYKSTPLYGGAIAVDLPSGFADASTIRQIPDHQEVYLDANGYASIVFDILEYVDKPTDGAALEYHFQDLVEGTGDSTDVLVNEVVKMGKVDAAHPVHHLSFLQTPQPNPNPHRKEPDFVSIHLLLLRLKNKGTDIVITINAPHYPGNYQKAEGGEKTKEMKDGDEITKKILETFEVRDWGLFGEEY